MVDFVPQSLMVSFIVLFFFRVLDFGSLASVLRRRIRFPPQKWRWRVIIIGANIVEGIVFLALDKPNALCLPFEPFQFYTWATCRVGVDYYIQVDEHYYSVPHAPVLIHSQRN